MSAAALSVMTNYGLLLACVSNCRRVPLMLMFESFADAAVVQYRHWRMQKIRNDAWNANMMSACQTLAWKTVVKWQTVMLRVAQYNRPYYTPGIVRWGYTVACNTGPTSYRLEKKKYNYVIQEKDKPTSLTRSIAERRRGMPSSLLGHWVHTWINHFSLVTATPDLRLPSQP